MLHHYSPAPPEALRDCACMLGFWVAAAIPPPSPLPPVTIFGRRMEQDNNGSAALTPMSRRRVPLVWR